METKLSHLIHNFFENSLDYKLIDIVIRGEGKNKVVEVLVDNESGVNVDDLAKLNRELNEMIDNRYDEKDISKLVVSSPGAERSFKYLWQLRKHIGRIIDVQMTNGEKLEGKLLEVQDDMDHYIIIDAKQTSTKPAKESAAGIDPELHKIYYSDIRESKVKLSFK